MQSTPLVLTVAKLACRWVIRKAVISGWRPFRVLSPVVATTSDGVVRLEVSASPRCATSSRGPRPGFRRRSRPKLSVVSDSRPVRVIRCCEHSIGPNPHGCERSDGPTFARESWRVTGDSDRSTTQRYWMLRRPSRISQRALMSTFPPHRVSAAGLVAIMTADSGVKWLSVLQFKSA